MKMKQIDYLYQLSFMPRMFPVNCYFIEEEDSLTLIDAALPYSYKAIIQAANEIGKPVKHIVLTHAHSDHIGSLDKLATLLPDIQVSISSRDAKLLQGDTELESGEENTPIKGGIPKNIQKKPDILLEDGDMIGSLIAISTPGHTPGHMAFLDTRTNALIAGDSFQTRGGIAVSGQLRPLFPFPAMATWNKEMAIESAERLLRLNPTLLAVGHGIILEKPMEKMKQAIEHAKKK